MDYFYVTVIVLMIGFVLNNQTKIIAKLDKIQSELETRSLPSDKIQPDERFISQESKELYIDETLLTLAPWFAERGVSDELAAKILFMIVDGQAFQAMNLIREELEVDMPVARKMVGDLRDELDV